MCEQQQGKYWLEGVKAREEGKVRDDNPYSKSETQVDQAYDWFMGWDTAEAVLGIQPKQDA